MVSASSITEAKLFDRALTRFHVDTESVEQTSSNLRHVVECLTELGKDGKHEFQVKHMVLFGQLMQRLEKLYPRLAPKVILPSCTATTAEVVTSVGDLIGSSRKLPSFLENGEADMLIQLKKELEDSKIGKR